MKKIINRILTGVLSASVLLAPINSLAYDRDDYDIGVNEEGDEFWYLDYSTHDGATAPITFYIYVDNSARGFYDGLYDRAYYTFDCYTNIPDERGDGTKINSIHLCKDFFLQGADPMESLSKGDIFILNDRIEPGEYTFCFPNAEGNNGIRTLSRTFMSPMTTDSNNFYVDTDIDQGKLEVVTVPDNVGVNVYMYYGNDEWSSDPVVMSEFINWAQDHEETWRMNVMQRYRDTGLELPDGVEDVVGSLVRAADPTPTPVDDFVPASGPTRVTSTSSNVLDEFPEMKAPQEEKKSALGPLILVLLVSAGCVGGFVWYKYKKDA